MKTNLYARLNYPVNRDNERRIVLVYQVGIANVFEVQSFNMSHDGRDAKRLMQADFRTCEAFARGMAAAGCLVTSMHCCQAGDIARAKWSDVLEDAPFSDEFYPVWNFVTV